MKAIVLNKYDDLNSLQEVEISKPQINTNEVLVENHTVAVDPVDRLISTGRFMGGNLPTILGSSLAGTVVEVGTNVSGFKVGDRVAANYRNGHTYAEFVSVPENLLAHIPDSISFSDAVSITLGGQTGLQGITRGLNVQAGQKIVILGASGSVGFIGLQTALNLGAEVFATASGWGLEMLNQNFPGVEVFDYKTEKLSDNLKDIDGVFDTVGNKASVDDAFSVLKPDGKFVSVALHQSSDRRFIHLVNNPQGSNIQFILDGIQNGSYKTIVDSVIPLTPENIQLDYSKIEKGGTHGKLVMAI
jgi:NADPH:quinone reductase-like Zn-dependent oxidoreductase